MKRIIRLTERDLTRIVKRAIKENDDDDKLKGYLKMARGQASTSYTYQLMKNIFEKYGCFIINWDRITSGPVPYIVGEIKGGEEVSMEEMVDKDTFKEVSNYYYSHIKGDMNAKLTNTEEKELYDHIINRYDGNSFPDWEPENVKGIFDLYSDDDENPISERYFRKRRY